MKIRRILETARRNRMLRRLAGRPAPTIHRWWGKTISYALMFFYVGLIVFPLYLMFVTSLKNNRQIFTKPFGLPSPADFSGYMKLFTVSQYHIYFRNSILVTLSALALIVVTSALASYALAKYKFPARIFIYGYFVAGLIIPIRLGTIGIMKTMINIGLFDTPWSLVIVFLAMGIPLGVFILYDFIRMIPEELSNSARIDGCSEHAIFRRIIVPLTKPALATVAIVNFIPVWNDFWFPLVLIRSNGAKTVPLATALLFGQFETNFGMVFAVLTMASLPVMIFYLFLSKYFIKGLTKGALKG
jgi:raffinose/stachyose/melibiose transport system permease protein